MTPRGPVGREQAGPPARHPDGALGGCPSIEFGPASPGRPRQDRPLTRAGPASSIRRPGPCRPPLVLVRTDPPVRTVNKSTWPSVGARRTAGSGPVFAHHAPGPPGSPPVAQCSADTPPLLVHALRPVHRRRAGAARARLLRCPRAAHRARRGVGLSAIRAVREHRLRARHLTADGPGGAGRVRRGVPRCAALGGPRLHS
jgi:hypothetical protein